MGPVAAARVLALLVACTIVTGCGGGSSVAKRQSTSIVAVIKGLDNPFFATMRKGLVAAADREHVQLDVDAAADVNDAAGQAARLRSHQGDNSSCYIVSPINATNLIAPLSSLGRGTTIVNIDLPIARSQASVLHVHVTTFIATDNRAAGIAAAEAMAAFVPRAGRIAVLTGPSGDANSQARIAGFRRGSRGRFRIVASAAADWDTAKAR